jgi:hypothetical protein
MNQPLTLTLPPLLAAKKRALAPLPIMCVSARVCVRVCVCVCVPLASESLQKNPVTQCGGGTTFKVGVAGRGGGVLSDIS